MCFSNYLSIFLDVSTTFTEVILEACLLPTILPDKFGLDYTMLVAIMHCKIGSEVGKYINKDMGIFYYTFYFTVLTCEDFTQGRGQYNYIINYYNSYEYSLIKFLY